MHYKPAMQTLCPLFAHITTCIKFILNYAQRKFVTSTYTILKKNYLPPANRIYLAPYANTTTCPLERNPFFLGKLIKTCRAMERESAPSFLFIKRILMPHFE